MDIAFFIMVMFFSYAYYTYYNIIQCLCRKSIIFSVFICKYFCFRSLYLSSPYHILFEKIGYEDINIVDKGIGFYYNTIDKTQRKDKIRASNL